MGAWGGENLGMGVCKRKNASAIAQQIIKAGSL